MMKNKITIAGRNIGEDYPPYIIAELSANHNGDFNRAIQIIQEAKRCGADALKIQTYKPDIITVNSQQPDFQINDGLWAGKTLYDLYQEAHTPWEWHKSLFDYARKLDITIFSSPFDNTAVDFLENLNAPAYKIASFEAVDLALIKYVASTGKPVIISTGMADENEIKEAIDAAREGGCKDLAILRCVSAYPAAAEDYNLRTIIDMKNRFGLVTGLSDHTIENTTAIASIALGASVIEKHFTLNREAGGPDDSFSLEPKDLNALCRDAKMAWSSLGSVNYGQKSSERGSIKFRRSLYFVKNLKKGQLITEDVVKSIRPGFGIAPKFLSQLIGKSVNQDVSAFSPVTMEKINL